MNIVFNIIMIKSQYYFVLDSTISHEFALQDTQENSCQNFDFVLPEESLNVIDDKGLLLFVNLTIMNAKFF